MNYSPGTVELRQYWSRIISETNLTSERNKRLFDAVYSCFTKDRTGFYYPEEKYSLEKTLWSGETSGITDIFSDSEFEVLGVLLGEQWGIKFKEVWDRITEYPYSNGYNRRSARSKLNDKLYLLSAARKLRGMVELMVLDFSYESYFAEQSDCFTGNWVIGDLLALEIDQGNELVMQNIYDIICGDNNTGLITREIIEGIVKSHNGMTHKWLGDLLLAAKLQEGLRQQIVESMDGGSRGGFLYLLKIILDYDLVRFSSVVRAFDVWTGMGIIAAKSAVIKKSLETVYRCLTERSYLEECLQSNDTLLIYIGIWASAFDEVSEIVDELSKLLAAEEKYKKLTALYFLEQIQFPLLQYELACRQLRNPDLEVICWVVANIYPHIQFDYIPLNEMNWLKEYQDIYDLEDLFFELKTILDALPRKKVVFKASVFSWIDISLDAEQLAIKMLLALSNRPTERLVDVILDYTDRMSVNTRHKFLITYLGKVNTPKQKRAIIEFMGDRSPYVRKAAMAVIKKLQLTDDDYRMIEDMLRYKAGDLRQNVISILLTQSPNNLLFSIQRLLNADDEQKTLAALDLVAIIDESLQFQSIAEECREMVTVLSEASQSQLVRELINKIGNKHNFTAQNGFGLYDPNLELSLPQITYPTGVTPGFEPDKLEAIFKLFSDLFKANRNYEYEAEYWDGSRKKVVLGGEFNLCKKSLPKPGRNTLTLDNYPLTEVWRDAVKKLELSAQNILDVLFYYRCVKETTYYGFCQDDDGQLQEVFPHDLTELTEFVKRTPYTRHIYTILSLLLQDYPSKEIFQICYDMLSYIFCTIPPESFAVIRKHNQNIHNQPRTLVDCHKISFWYELLKAHQDDAESFQKSFYLRYAFYRVSGFRSCALIQLEDLERAFELELIDERELYAELCGRPCSPQKLHALTFPRRRNNSKYSLCPGFNQVCKNVIDRVVGIELRRGDMPTEVSHLAIKIYHCIGAKFFVDILVGSVKETYIRGYNSVGSSTTKQQIFSHLLTYCYPDEDEDEDTLRKLLKNRQVTDRQLIDAAMYAPQWLDIVERYLGWPGLKSAGWYFHAHVNDTFSEKKMTIVSRYSALTPEEFAMGSFDINWFREAYAALGEKRFQMVYESAKYIGGGRIHKRAQIFVDAVLGRITVGQAEQVITEKRNKDYVLSYGLIPLNDKEEILHRYEFLQQFLKESKQFGAQRRDSEGKVVTISLKNLARNAGFADVIRFTWYMETEKIRAIARFLQPRLVGEYEVQISINDLGKAKMVITRDGKIRKSIPAVIRKDEYIVELKAVIKSLKEQHSRARSLLEKAMESAAEFMVDELQNLTLHPVFAPFLQKLIFKCGDKLGYFQDSGLIDVQGHLHPLNADARCIVAHPVHLFESGQWSEFQRDIFRRQIVQPFKQVFRELYLPNRDELAEGMGSSRYAGHQIQPKKAVALLQSRGWVADYYEGVQKVDYQENIITHIRLLADWFSPADVEAPTIEGVQFSDRRTGVQVAIADIPPVIFSERMRDIDLVVNVAHVGGVDPEASLSTIELRSLLVGEMVRLLKLKNVELKGVHAFIKGSLGEYIVHLGSGLVQQLARGALFILPVHSQHRGRIFLPFMDDDPKTAEIISKITLLAEDHKIKDPSILEQISRTRLS